mgnify:CR=1 FL=1
MTLFCLQIILNENDKVKYRQFLIWMIVSTVIFAIIAQVLVEMYVMQAHGE